ncbi:MAG: toxin-antitoxin system YwqK family antitoxin [Flavobacteriales bacterium]
MKSVLITILFSFSAFLISAQSINKTNSQGKKHGDWIVKYEGTSTVKYKGRFKNGVPAGLFIFYYENGMIKAKNKYFNNGKDSYASTYYDNGKLMSMGKYVSQKRDSVWVFLDKWGNYVAKESYKNGAKHGKCVDFYPFNPKFDQGQPKILEVMFYSNGELDGEYQKYYQNGKLLLEGNNELGRKKGKWTTYYPTGKKRTEIYYKRGVKNGYVMNYDGNGQLTTKQYFVDGYELKGKQLELHFELKKKRKQAESQGN